MRDQSFDGTRIRATTENPKKKKREEKKKIMRPQKASAVDSHMARGNVRRIAARATGLRKISHFYCIVDIKTSHGM